LAIAARSIDIPKHKDWASSWSRVSALILARIGSAHCYATNIKLCEQATRERAIKREARRYVASLVVSVAETPQPDWWGDASADLRRINCIQVFFLGKHRLVGLIEHNLLPQLTSSASMKACKSSHRSTTTAQHSYIWQPPECVRTDPFFLDSECLDTNHIMHMNSEKASVMALVAQSLAIAARSLPKPLRREWACSWSRVKALTLARLGSAHRSIKNANVSCLETKEEIRANGIKREAQLYVVALISSVESTPSLHKWRANLTDLITITLFEDFFMDGGNHRELGFIHPDFLPAYCPNLIT
jgi:hypothetical protein